MRIGVTVSGGCAASVVTRTLCDLREGRANGRANKGKTAVGNNIKVKTKA